MPISVPCQCGKTLNVRDELAGKAVKCPACQKILQVPASKITAAAAQPAKAAPRPATPVAKPVAKPSPPTAAAVAATAAARESDTMDSFYADAGFEIKRGKFCPECSEAILPDAILCTRCGYHLESGTKLDAYQSTTEAPDSVNAVLRKAELDMARAKALQVRLENAGMPAWMVALGLFVLTSLLVVAVIAVNISKSKDETASFNAVATLLLLSGIAFAAVAIGSYCVVLYRAFKADQKQGMFVLLIPFYVFYYSFIQFKVVGKAFLVFLIAAGTAAGLFVLASMSNSGQL